MTNLNNAATEFEGKKFKVVTGTIPTKTAKVELVEHIGAVVILPFASKDEILLIRNNRWAVGKTLYELPAGTLERNEEPRATALRELEEETGYSAKKITPLLEFYSSPGYSTEKLYAFLAEDLAYVGQRLEESEEITVETIPLFKAFAMIQTNEIEDAKTISTLLYFSNFIL